ncbi:MAG TPA: PQ-loop domain-containing transporter [Patescibacteria group bacterium]|nr:PQ-loop domain-containing transporter [Patescibacteria group bacterium]
MIVEIVGIFATLFSMIAFIPQAIQTWRTKRTKDISLTSYLILSCSAFLWTVAA